MKTPIQNRLKEYRQKTGFTQLDIARQLGFTTNNRICRWERGIAVPSIMNLGKLCKIYKAYPHELYSELFSISDSYIEDGILPS